MEAINYTCTFLPAEEKVTEFIIMWKSQKEEQILDYSQIHERKGNKMKNQYHWKKTKHNKSLNV